MRRNLDTTPNLLQHVLRRRTIERMASTFTMPPQAATLGRRIAQARRFSDIDQTDMAHMIGVVPRAEMLRRLIAAALDA